MGRLIDADYVDERIEDELAIGADRQEWYERIIDDAPTIEAIPKDNVYKAIQEMMKYEHEGFINISLARFDEILKKCGVQE